MKTTMMFILAMVLLLAAVATAWDVSFIAQSAPASTETYMDRDRSVLR